MSVLALADKAVTAFSGLDLTARQNTVNHVRRDQLLRLRCLCGRREVSVYPGPGSTWRLSTEHTPIDPCPDPYIYFELLLFFATERLFATLSLERVEHTSLPQVRPTIITLDIYARVPHRMNHQSYIRSIAPTSLSPWSVISPLPGLIYSPSTYLAN